MPVQSISRAGEQCRAIQADSVPGPTSAGSRLGAVTLYSTPGNARKGGYCPSFNGKLRGELLERELFTTLREAQVLVED